MNREIFSSLLFLIATLSAGGCVGTAETSSSGGAGGGTTTSSLDCSVLPTLPYPTEPYSGVEVCAAGDWLYKDSTCGPYGGGCSNYGDGRCHKQCSTDADCADQPCRPICAKVGLYKGYDACLWEPSIHVCHSIDEFGCHGL